jgi:hypothetical protein
LSLAAEAEAEAVSITAAAVERVGSALELDLALLLERPTPSLLVPVVTVALLQQMVLLVQILYLALLLPQAVVTAVILVVAHQVETAVMAVPAVAVRAFRLRQADQVLAAPAIRQARLPHKATTVAAFQRMDCRTQAAAVAVQLLLDRLAVRVTALAAAATEPPLAFLAHL